ncbi:MAG: HEAT repeat domain-containing protein [Acidobacteriota bacterium]
MTEPTATVPPNSARSRRPSLLITIVAMLFVIVPFLFWYGTWFGRELNDSEMEKYLNDTNSPRKLQHALSQLAQRIARHDEKAKRWYTKILALAEHPVSQVRITAAWVMGQDNTSQDFHDALLRLLVDSHPMVRRNSALSLVRFADTSGRPELLLMLRPYSIQAEREGTVSLVLTEEQGDQELPVTVAMLLVRITEANGQVFEVRSPLSGYLKSISVKEGTKVMVGDELALVSPEPSQVWESLRALCLVGQPEDLPEIELYARGMPGMNEQIRRQALLTADAIRNHKNQQQTEQ